MDLDLAIVNGRVVDGSGASARLGTVGIHGDRIAWIGPEPRAPARRIIDAAGMVVCPGFIDMHAHSELLPLVEPGQPMKVMQGVTTEVIGQDGLSTAPVTDQTLPFFRSTLRALSGEPPGVVWDWRSVDEYLARLDRGTAVNFAMLAPHGNLRAAVLGLDNRRATTQEIGAMQWLLEQAFQQGVFGLSTGLTYAPCSFGDTEELVELCRVVARCGGYFAPHLRSYGADMEAALEEAIDISARSGAPLHLTHFQASFATGRGKADFYLERIRRARAAGLEVTLDAYPYLAGSTFLAGLLPGWAHEGGHGPLLKRLQDPETRQRIRHEMEVTGSDGLHKIPAPWDAIVLSDVSTAANATLVGLSLAEIARRKGCTPFDCFADLLLEENLAASCVVFIGHEDNLQKFMQDPYFMAASDGLLMGKRPHPRAWGTFARYLARYVRQLGVLSLEVCVRKMTALPAQRLGLNDRGRLAEGMAADVVIFDPETVQDTATYDNPKSYPLGIPYVIVNGQVVKDADQPTGALAGRALRHQTPR